MAGYIQGSLFFPPELRPLWKNPSNLPCNTKSSSLIPQNGCPFFMIPVYPQPENTRCHGDRTPFCGPVGPQKSPWNQEVMVVIQPVNGGDSSPFPILSMGRTVYWDPCEWLTVFLLVNVKLNIPVPWIFWDLESQRHPSSPENVVSKDGKIKIWSFKLACNR